MSSLCLVDLSSLFWTSWHASANGELSEAFQRTVAAVHRAREGCDHVAVCCDRKPYDRQKLFPEYKANREASPPLAWGELQKVKDRLAKDGLLLWEVEGQEADDIIATAVQHAIREDPPMAVTIVSSDKDLLQLCRFDGVNVYSPASQKRFGAADVFEKFKVTPSEIPDYLALVGDKSDNIAGCEGVGPVHAARLIKEYGGVEGIIAAALTIKPPSIAAAVQECAERIRLAKRLVTLNEDVRIDFDAVFAERKPAPIAKTDDYDAEFEDAADDPLDAIGPPVVSAGRAPEGGTNAAVSAKADSVNPPGEQPKPDPKPQPAAAHESAAGSSLVVAAPQHVVPFERGLEPMTMMQAWKFANAMFNSRLYTRLTSPEAVWGIITRGRELGLGALTALDCIDFVEGRPALKSWLIISMCRNDPECDYLQMVELDERHATWIAKNRRHPHEVRLGYTIDQAHKAKLIKPGSAWEKRPDDMLNKTCGSKLGRIEFSRAALGLYSLAELGADDD